MSIFIMFFTALSVLLASLSPAGAAGAPTTSAALSPATSASPSAPATLAPASPSAALLPSGPAGAPEAVAGNQCNPGNSTLGYALALYRSGGYDGFTGEYLGEEDSALVDVILRLRYWGVKVNMAKLLVRDCYLAEVEPGTPQWRVYLTAGGGAR